MMFRQCVTEGEERHLYFKEAREVHIRLDLSTNPLGFPKSVMLSQDLFGSISSYPFEPELHDLIEAIATHSGISEDQVLITSGVDQGIEIVLTHILEKGDTLSVREPTFPMFDVIARRVCGANVVKFRDINKTPESKAIVICTPNNPTTEETKLGNLRTLIKNNNDKTVIIDAIFSDFGSFNPSVLVGEFNNVVVLKGLSKSFGMPGIRVGWIESQKQNIEMFRRGVSPFRVPIMCQKLALVALRDKNHIRESISFLNKEFSKIREAFKDNVFRESSVPFFLFFTEDSGRLQKFLLDRGISVISSKSFGSFERDFVRIMIGREEQNTALMQVLKEFTQA